MCWIVVKSDFNVSMQCNFIKKWVKKIYMQAERSLSESERTSYETPILDIDWSKWKSLAWNEAELCAVQRIRENMYRMRESVMTRRKFIRHLVMQHTARVNFKLQCMRETYNDEKEIQLASCVVAWTRSHSLCEKRVMMRRKFKKHHALYHISKEWTCSCSVCEKCEMARKKLNKHQVKYHGTAVNSDFNVAMQYNFIK